MVNVAVAGGAGKLGLTIVEHLKENSKHNVIVLSRKVGFLGRLPAGASSVLQIGLTLNDSTAGHRSPPPECARPGVRLQRR